MFKWIKRILEQLSDNLAYNDRKERLITRVLGAPPNLGMPLSTIINNVHDSDFVGRPRQDVVAFIERVKNESFLEADKDTIYVTRKGVHSVGGLTGRS